MTPTPPAKRLFRVSGLYLLAVLGIYATTACAWLILWRVMDNRSNDKDHSMRSQVGVLWGGEHSQIAPELTLHKIEPPASAVSAAKATSPVPAATPAVTPAVTPGTRVTQAAAAVPVIKDPSPSVAPFLAAWASKVPPACRPEVQLKAQRTRADVRLDLGQRRKGLLWYSTYRVRFTGQYTFKNTTACPREATLWIPFPARGAVYDEFTLTHAGKEVPVEVTSRDREPGAAAALTLRPGEARTFTVSYNSRGLDKWSYFFGKNTARAKDFKLKVATNFEKIDFPEGTLSPTRKKRTSEGWALTWQFGNILADTNIAVGLPHKINPGPLAAQISLFAPVSLGFFFFVLLLVSVIKQVRLHPVHYGMLAAAFFAFHLLLAYMVDHVPLWVAFSISSVTSVGLVVSYLRLAVGSRFAMLWAGGAQMVYLILFSLAFFLEGYTGLTITIFSVLTLFVVMQLTGRIDWSRRAGQSGPGDHPDAEVYPGSSFADGDAAAAATPAVADPAAAASASAFSRVS
jgi:Inner membrane protein CreD